MCVEKIKIRLNANVSKHCLTTTQRGLVTPNAIKCWGTVGQLMLLRTSSDQ